MSAPSSTSASPLLKFGRIAVGVEFAVAVVVIVYAGCHLARAVFAGAPAAVPSGLSATCAGVAGSVSCHVSTLELNPGRYRVATDGASSSLTVTITSPLPQRARQLLVRVSAPAKLRVAIQSAAYSGQPAREIELTDFGGRVVTPLSTTPPLELRFTSDAGSSAPIVLDELGLFESARGLLSDDRLMFGAIPPSRYHDTLVPRAIVRLCLFTIVAALFLPAAGLRRIEPLVLSMLCFSLCVLDLAVLFSPYGGHDLRAYYAGGPLLERAGANLNGGLWEGFRFLQGKGLTFFDGVVPWERMPGYGLFCAMAGTVFGHRTLLELAMSTVLLQVVFYSVAVGVLAWAAASLMPPSAVWALGLIVSWLPKQVGLTQVDALIAPVAMLVLAALCVRLKPALAGRHVPIAADIAVHATFALWFAMRPDVLPAWLVVSLCLHWRNWRRLLIPVTFFLAIGGGWGAYKAGYTGEFALTTSSAGASLFCGLWEVPSRFRFAMICTDSVYFDWIHQHTMFQPQSIAANNFATREVLRFWLTYPGHFVVMVNDKMMQMFGGDLWPGYPTQLQASVFQVVPRYWMIESLLTIIALCVALGHQRLRTLLLAWPLFLDAPIFWVMFASLGRFYSAVGIALLAAAVPPLFEKEFYAAIAARPWRAAAVLGCAGVFAIGAWPLHGWLLRNDAFHYWTPFLDPARSPLNAFK